MSKTSPSGRRRRSARTGPDRPRRALGRSVEVSPSPTGDTSAWTAARTRRTSVPAAGCRWTNASVTHPREVSRVRPMAHVLVTGGVRSGKSRYAESLLSVERSGQLPHPRLPRRPDHGRRVGRPRRRAPAAPSGVVADGGDARPRRRRRRRARPGAHRLPRHLAHPAVRLLAGVGRRGRPSGRSGSSEKCPPLSVLYKSTRRRGRRHQRGRLGAGVGVSLRTAVRRHLGRVNQQVAAACDQVVLMVAGRPLSL